MSKVKNSQVKNFPLGSNDRVKVQNVTSFAIPAGAIMAVQGLSSTGVLKVGSAASQSPTGLTSRELFVCDYDLPSGRISDFAVPWKIIGNLDTSEARVVGVPIYLNESLPLGDGTFSYLFEGCGKGQARKIGIVLEKDATDGSILLAPQMFGTFDERYERSQSVVFPGDSTAFSITMKQPPHTMLLDVGICQSGNLSISSSGNLTLIVESSAGAADICASTNLISSATSSPAGSVSSVLGGSCFEGAANMSFLSSFPRMNVGPDTRDVIFRANGTSNITGELQCFMKYVPMEGSVSTQRKITISA